MRAGGTITHHHAVGRDHRPWYDRQRPRPFVAALRAAKAAVDPNGILNPGVFIDPPEPALTGRAGDDRERRSYPGQLARINLRAG
jgi:alkyldihydroxyacetonephosphate synthase